jgi:hypothetical protein
MCKEQKNNRKLKRMKAIQITESTTEKKETDSNRMKKKSTEERKRT